MATAFQGYIGALIAGTQTVPFPVDLTKLAATQAKILAKTPLTLGELTFVFYLKSYWDLSQDMNKWS